MVSKLFALSLALSSLVSAAPALQARQKSVESCQAAYQSCVKAGTPEVACGCTLATCVGEDNGRTQDFCASATANLGKPSSTTAAASYACNPAHSYPNGAKCVSTVGTLSLVTPAPSAAASYACNPAHSYPNGAKCVSSQGTLSLVTPAASAPATTYACNPAHSYPGGASCISTNGALTLKYPATSTAAPSACTTQLFDGCNPAHTKCPNGPGTFVTVTPSTYPTSYFVGCNPARTSCSTGPGTFVTISSAPSFCITPTSKAAPASVTPAPSACTTQLFDGCNPAHTKCPDGPGTFVTVTPSTYPTSYFVGCNPARTSCSTGPGTFVTISSAPSFCLTPTSTATPTPVAPTKAAASAAGKSPNPAPVKTNKSWKINDLIRYCAADDTSCQYNFNLEANGKSTHCKIDPQAGASAATQSWYNLNCSSTASNIKVSWGYADSSKPAFAVMTVAEGKEMAWFGVFNVNGQKDAVTFGSGTFGSVGPEPVYTY